MKIALLGKNLTHSYSAIFHNSFFKDNNINANYEIININNDKELKEILLNKEYIGFNVTIPYKEKVIEFLDELYGIAKNIKSVNTILRKENKLIGFNTDYNGFIESMKLYNIDPLNKETFILGTGGASKACYQALLDLGSNPFLVSREKKEYGKIISYNELLNNFDSYYLIVNATPLGMFPNVENNPLSNIDFNYKNINYAFDLIYNPSITNFMKLGKESFNGLYMLCVQAICSLNIWFNLNIEDYLSYYDKFKDVIR